MVWRRKQLDDRLTLDTIDVPLNDEELIYVCQTSTNSETNRVLVIPIEGYQLICQQFYHHPNAR